MSHVPADRPYGRTEPGPPAVVAHRGASEEAPEHTLAAYRTAIEEGADALECDVRLTADGHLVCVHDRRVNRTSDGRGAVSALELADLAALDFGSWKAREARRDEVGRRQRETPEEPDWERTSVLTLERLLELVTDAGRRVELAIETKHPTRWAGQVEEKLVELLRRFGLAGPPAPGAHGGGGALRTAPGAAPAGDDGDDAASLVRVMSFSARSLHRVRAAAPAVPTVFLMQFLLPRFRDGRLPRGVGIAGPSLRIVRANPGYVARLHRAGHRVHVWTVDEPDDVALCARLGVEAVITNRPRQVRAQLDRLGYDTPPTGDA
ncbi:glycerophosphodiester phosphodiesterase family protein [Streptomyces sp. WMMC500]|uniref:glycerophosphodiester phosphodiesterase family protein n=1 Tax=Streptomyces sp. WMMC500 TaxID=3015154 RepID=UPI00248CE2DE|nr:glycerophosphodiester phosphodiesterase family protein [Streptomyces sp. WMMC500]WBB58031.1 glycerophosphodiester phosphodiesterase family protein [Streptomyces sp. WMMC500]